MEQKFTFSTFKIERKLHSNSLHFASISPLKAFQARYECVFIESQKGFLRVYGYVFIDPKSTHS